MRNVLISTLLLSASSVSGQLSLETQLGGSNYLGLTLNARYAVALSTCQPNYLVLTAGMGKGFTNWSHAPVLHSGLDYQMARWGIGIEASYIAETWSNMEPMASFGDMLLVYPNLSFSQTVLSRCYFRLAAGGILAWDRDNTARPGLSYAGDAIPFGSLAVGCTIK
jgi:hypothetical protein